MPTHPQEQRGQSEVHWISDKTKMSVGVASALAICGSIIASTWAARGYIENWRAEIGDHFIRIEISQARVANDLATANAALSARWSLGQMQAWSAQLSGANRALLRADGTTGLISPDPSNIPQRPE